MDDAERQAKDGAEFAVEALLAAEVAEDGSAAELVLLTAEGEEARLSLPAPLVARLLVALLELLAEMQRRGSGSEFVYPARSLRLDQVNVPGHALLTFTTTEGLRLPLLIEEAHLAALGGVWTALPGAERAARH